MSEVRTWPEPPPITTPRLRRLVSAGLPFRAAYAVPPPSNPAFAAFWANYSASWLLAGLIAAETDIPVRDVLEAIVAPALVNLLDSLLSSPDGWVTLAGYISAQWDVPAPTFSPTVH